MPKINILNILPGDNQSALIDKINYNFDQILTSGGGPQGQPGARGYTGPIGPQGSPGITGPQGTRGSKWYVEGPTAPVGANVDDYWLNSTDKQINKYTTGGWVGQGIYLTATEKFSRYLGATKDVVYVNDLPDKFGLLLSDRGTTSGGAYSPYGSPDDNMNQERAKFKIATEVGSDYNSGPLISFGRSDFDATNATAGNPGWSIAHNPQLKWRTAGTSGSSTPTSTGIWDMQFFNPTGAWEINANNSSVTLSASVNYLKSVSSTGGTIVNISSSGNGFFQVLGPSAMVSSANPYFGVSATGAGIGVQPSISGLTVKGDVSIGSTSPYYSYQISGSTGGSLIVQNYLSVGATAYNQGNIPATFTGLGRPKLVVSGISTGRVMQLRTDTSGAENSLLSWGDSSVLTASSAKNILVQDYVGSPSAGTIVAGIYQSGGNQPYDGDNRMFSIETFWNQKTVLSTSKNVGQIFLNANPTASSRATSDSVRIGAYSTYPLRIFSTTGGVRINPYTQPDSPLANTYTYPNTGTKFSVEGPVAIGSFPGVPIAANTIATADVGAEFTNNSYVRISKSSLDGDPNGLHVDNVIDNSIGVNFGYNGNRSRSIIITATTVSANGFSVTKRPVFAVGPYGETRIGFENTNSFNGMTGAFTYYPNASFCAINSNISSNTPTNNTFYGNIFKPRANYSGQTETTLGDFNTTGTIPGKHAEALRVAAGTPDGGFIGFHPYWGYNTSFKSSMSANALQTHTGGSTGTGTDVYSGLSGNIIRMSGPEATHFVTNNWSGSTFNGVLYSMSMFSNGAISMGNPTADSSSYGTKGPGMVRLFVNGDLTVSGTIRAAVGSVTAYSMRDLKKNVENLFSSYDIIKGLNPVTFEWKENGRKDAGFIVEDMEKIVPQIIDYTKDGDPAGYSITGLVSVLTKSVQELMTKVESLEAEIVTLKNK